jgi:hypothetical protein
LVPTFFTVTAAPGTTSLLGLLTTPPIEPVVVDCANATALIANTNKPTKQSFTIFDIQGNSLKMVSASSIRRRKWLRLESAEQDATSTMLSLL